MAFLKAAAGFFIGGLEFMATSKQVRFRYWKIEKAEDPWKLIPDTKIAKNMAIRQGAMFFTWVAFSESYSNDKHSEPVRFGDLPLDFDSKEDPQIALKEMRELCLLYLPEFYNLDPYALEFYCSGGKGFHAIIPA